MNTNQIIDVLENTLQNIKKAISNIDYAESYSFSSATSSYCSSAKDYLYNMEKNLTELINCLTTKEETSVKTNNDEIERSL